MEFIIKTLICLASILLVIVVLIQKSKGGGLAASASNYNQIMGVRKTTDFVEKATWGLAIFICVLSIASAFISRPTIVQGSSFDNFSKTTATKTENEKNTNYPTAAPAQGQQQQAPAQSGAKK